MGVGAVAGASGTVWAERKVRARVEALSPEHAARAAAERARGATRTLVDAVVEGRAAMREREQELRDRRDRRPDGRTDGRTDGRSAARTDGPGLRLVPGTGRGPAAGGAASARR